MQYKAVFFDLDDTLCHADRAWRKAEQAAFDHLMLCSYPGLTELEARRAWESVHQELFARLDSNTLNMAEVRELRFHRTLEVLGVSDLMLADELNSLLSKKRLAYMTLFDGAIETLSALRAQGHVGIITNGAADEHRDSQYTVAKQLNLISCIDSLWISDVVGFRKPATEIFQCALDHIGIQACEAVFVGDSLPKDIAGANRTGMVSVLISPSTVPPVSPPQDEQPDYTIRHLSELLQMV